MLLCSAGWREAGREDRCHQTPSYPRPPPLPALPTCPVSCAPPRLPVPPLHRVGLLRAQSGPASRWHCGRCWPVQHGACPSELCASSRSSLPRCPAVDPGPGGAVGFDGARPCPLKVARVATSTLGYLPAAACRWGGLVPWLRRWRPWWWRAPYVGGRRGWVSSHLCPAISVMLVCSMALQMAAMAAVFSPMRGEPWQWWW